MIRRQMLWQRLHYACMRHAFLVGDLYENAQWTLALGVRWSEWYARQGVPRGE